MGYDNKTGGAVELGHLLADLWPVRGESAEDVLMVQPAQQVCLALEVGNGGSLACLRS